MCFCHGTQKNQAGIDLEAPTPWSSFHGVRRCHAGYWGESHQHHPQSYLALDQRKMKYVAGILTVLNNKTWSQLSGVESWRIREAEQPATRVLTSTNAQTKGVILPLWICRLHAQIQSLDNSQTALSSCLLPPYISLSNYITPVSTSLVLGLKAYDPLLCVSSVSLFDRLNLV